MAGEAGREKKSQAISRPKTALKETKGCDKQGN